MASWDMSNQRAYKGGLVSGEDKRTVSTWTHLLLTDVLTYQLSLANTQIQMKRRRKIHQKYKYKHMDIERTSFWSMCLHISCHWQTLLVNSYIKANVYKRCHTKDLQHVRLCSKLKNDQAVDTWNCQLKVCLDPSSAKFWLLITDQWCVCMHWTSKAGQVESTVDL